MRMCLSCREMKPKRELIRIVMNKNGEISVDMTGKLACNSAECAAKLKKVHGIERNFGCKADAAIYDDIERALTVNEK